MLWHVLIGREISPSCVFVSLVEQKVEDDEEDYEDAELSANGMDS